MTKKNKIAPVIAVVSTKGGCGKTVTSVNLAAVLAQHGYRVLLIDLDGQYAATGYYNATPPSPAISATVYDVLCLGAPLSEAATPVLKPSPLQAKRKGGEVWLLAGDPRMATLDRALAHEPTGDLKLGRILNAVKGGAGFANKWDICLLDAPSGWGGATRAAVMAATHLIVPINSEMMAFDCAVDTVAKAEQEVGRYIADGFDRAPPQYRILLTALRRTIASAEVEEVAEANWPERVFTTRVRFSEEIKRLSADRKTVVDRKAATLREDYQDLSKEICTWLQQ